jgi:Holliday junction DNA helicase RuvB
MDSENQSFLNAKVNQGEEFREIQLRPKNFEEYIGQENVIDNIKLMVNSSNIRKKAMDHVLLSGPPGLGKTSLAMLVAQALGTELHVISGPAVEKKGDLAAILTNLKPRDVLFIDEIHRLHISIEEILYSAMEDFRLDIVIGQGPSARTMQISIPPFTLIGATTRSGLLSNPLRDRFIAHLHFDYYTIPELVKIIRKNAEKMALKIDEEALVLIASRSRGTPRIVNRILHRVRDYAVVTKLVKIDQAAVESSLKLMNIDKDGLDRMDRKIIETMSKYYNGGPVGIDALCATLGEDRGTVEDVYEPYLLKEGFIMRTARGRILSERAVNSLNNL